MPSDAVIQEVVASLDVARWLEEQGIRLRGAGDERSMRCPFHEDRNPSLSINVRTGLWHCHGCQANGNIFRLYMRLRGVGFTEAVVALGARAGVDVSGNGHRPARVTPPAPGREAEVLAAYTPPPVPAERELDEALATAFHENLQPEHRTWLLERRGLTSETCDRWQLGFDGTRYIIPIRDADGVLRNLRCYNPRATEGPKMTSWRRGTGAARLWPATYDAEPAAMAWICAGEWDRLLAWQLGLEAYTNTAGEGTWDEAWNETFRDRDVVVAYDFDDAGRAGVALVARALRTVGARVMCVDWTRWEPATAEDAPKGYDLTDAVVRDGLTVEQLTGLVVDAPAEVVVSEVRDVTVDEALRRDPPMDRVPPGHGYGPGASLPPVALYTEFGNARRVVAHFGHVVRYHASRGWLLYAAGRWYADTEDAVRHLALRSAQRILEEVGPTDDDATRKRVWDWARTSLSSKNVNGTMTLLRVQPEVAIQAEEPFDRDPWLLNCLNGTLDLRTGTLRPHDPADLMLKQVPVAYDPTATCPRWDAFVGDILRHDATLINYMHRALGYALTGATSEHAVFILWGRGSNGKSTLLEMMLEVLGNYGTAMNFSTLTGRTQQGPSEDVARLAGVRFSKAVEAGAGHKFNEPMLKELTGGDTIAARFLFKHTFVFRPQFKLFLGVNDRPKVAGTDEGIWRRMHLVPFTAEFSNDPEKLARGAKPKAESHVFKAALRAELPGILAWLVRGCRAWQEGGLQVPEEVRAATASYRAENDTVRGFITDRCVVEPTASVAAQELYESYVAWCEARDEEALNVTNFGRRLTAMNYARHRSGTVRRRGLRLRDSIDDIVAAGEEDVNVNRHRAEVDEQPDF